MPMLFTVLIVFSSALANEPNVQVTPGTSADVLYYFHGGGGEAADALIDLMPILKELSPRGGWPKIVSVSYGPFWVYNPARPELDDFVKIRERAEAGRPPRRRFLYGFSMGAFNALQVLIRHSRTFDRAALVSPMLLPIGPYASDAEIAAFSARSGVPERSQREGAFAIRELLAFLRSQFTESEWARMHLNPPTATPLLVSVSPQDVFFNEGASDFAQAAIERGCSVVLSRPSGGHPGRDDQAVTEFFSR